MNTLTMTPTDLRAPAQAMVLGGASVAIGSPSPGAWYVPVGARCNSVDGRRSGIDVNDASAGRVAHLSTNNMNEHGLPDLKPSGHGRGASQ